MCGTLFNEKLLQPLSTNQIKVPCFANLIDILNVAYRIVFNTKVKNLIRDTLTYWGYEGSQYIHKFCSTFT